MLRRFLIVSAFVLFGSIASFAQSQAGTDNGTSHGTNNCPEDKVQVTIEAKIDIPGIEGGIKEVYCEDKGKTPIDKGEKTGGDLIDKIKDFFGRDN